jgi:5-methylcytosine-specific restriction endonuclease McrA
MEEKRILAMREKIANGEWTYLKGPENPLWTGGPEAARRRQIESGKAKKRLMAYRKNNPDRVREWKQKRDRGYLEKLPYGTIPKLKRMQSCKCACCERSIKDGYHVDHIVPISKGGKHEPKNLQLLCPTCNLRKSNLMPHEFAQKNGKLL